MNKIQYVLILSIASAIAISIPILANALTTTTTTDNADRRSYTWCPLNQTNIASFNGELDGCPLTRVYVNNWHSLTALQQTSIDIMLRSKGFIDSGEDTLIK